jgi:hypothetical protein
MKTRKQLSMTVLAFALLVIALPGCKKDKDDNAPSGKTVKYEITGNFSGAFTVIINDNVSGNLVLYNITLPWSKEVTYDSKVIGVGVGAAATTYGVPGQTAVMKIYSGGTVVKTSNGQAGSNGEMSIPALSHVF